MNNLAWRTTEVPFNTILNTNSKETNNSISMNLTSQFLILVQLIFNSHYIKLTLNIQYRTYHANFYKNIVSGSGTLSTIFNQMKNATSFSWKCCV